MLERKLEQNTEKLDCGNVKEMCLSRKLTGQYISHRIYSWNKILLTTIVTNWVMKPASSMHDTKRIFSEILGPDTKKILRAVNSIDHTAWGP